ncbi:MAG: putative metal-dependent hydrolase [Acidobacteriota bacterium]|nr:putative metal-dependent hydrolase [Acidobacteriota bacterium]
MEDLRYPIGRFIFDGQSSDEQRQRFIDEIADAPARLRAAVDGLTPEQIETPYRPGGWTVRQVVHHVADSHLNSQLRFRLALTEDEPTIKAYDETAWAELADARTGPLDVSLTMLDVLHQRWVMLLRSLQPEDFARTFRHPEQGLVTLDRTLALYAWHGRHHTAHVTHLRKRMSWT